MVRMKRQQAGSNLNSLTSFDDARVLLDENINMVISLSFNNVLFINKLHFSGRLLSIEEKKESNKSWWLVFYFIN